MPDVIERREIRIGAGTYDEKTRTVDVIWSTGAAVKRYSWDEGYFMEELSMDPAHIRMGRFDGMSLLDSHKSYSMEHRLGTVVAGSARVSGGKGYAKVKLLRTPAGEAVAGGLQDGHPFSVSVGYKIHASEKREGQEGQLPTLRATDWEPLEISAVPIPADAGASTRSMENSMDPEAEEIERGAPPAEPTFDQQMERHNQRMERPITPQVKLDLTRKHSLPSGFNRAHGMKTEREYRNAIFEHQVEQQERTISFPIVETRGLQDEVDTRRAAIANALLHRSGIVKELAPAAREWRGLTAIEIARQLDREGGGWGRGSVQEVASRAFHTTSDFPLIMADVGRQTALEGYRSLQNTFQLFANRNVVPDFREVKPIEFGAPPKLLPVNEHGEFRRGTMREGETGGFAVATYGHVVGCTRQLLINDRLDIFVNAIRQWGRQAAKLEGDVVWNVIINNAKLKDGTGIFDASRGNLGAAAALSVDAIKAGRKAMRKFKDVDGEQIAIQPQFLFVGTELEIDAKTLVAAPYQPATAGAVTPEAVKSLQVIYEPRIDQVGDYAWFLFADQSEAVGRGVQYAYLNGQEEPFFDERPGFDIDGIEFKIRHDFGAGVTDWRFGYKNPGAAPA